MQFTELHQKVAIALIAGATIIAISGIFSNKQRKEAQLRVETAEAKKPIDTKPDTGDADEDGVPDWQEILYGTDPNKKDSNPAGVSEKDFIEAKKAEREAQFKDAPSLNIAPIPAGASTTDATADALVGAFFLKQSAKGTTLDTAEKSAIIKNTMKKLDALPYTQYPPESLLTRADTSATSIRTYQKDVASALKKLQAITEYELQTYARAVDKNDSKEFAKLSDAALIYENIAKDMSKIQVPTDALEHHAAYVNGFSYTAAALKGMGKGYDDVVGSYRAFGHFGKAEQELRMAKEALSVYFTLKDIAPL